MPVTIIIRVTLIAMLVVGTFCSPTYAVEFIRNTSNEILGEDPGLGISFSTVEKDTDYLIVTIKLRNGKTIRANVDYLTKSVSIQSIREHNEQLVAVSQQDFTELAMLGRSLGPLKGRAGDALTSLFSLLSEAPRNQVINVSAGSTRQLGGPQQQIEPQQREEQVPDSLCDRTGIEVPATYDTIRGIKGETIIQGVDVSVCYDEETECLGRCGRGCGGGLRGGVGGDPTIQRFTQDCLNHDFCARERGVFSAFCTDEFRRTTDDFFFAADCGNVTDTWNDNFGFIWNLSQSDNTVTGSVDVTTSASQCGTPWSVAGTHVGADISLTATNPPPIEEGCCAAFTYTGPLNSCKTANGTWTNRCEASGEWSVSREGAIQPIPSPGGVNPASSKPGDTCDPNTPDTTPPTTPTDLIATAISSSQINLSWTASMDNLCIDSYRVERCEGAGCTTFTLVGRPTANSFSNTDLAANTSYTYRVRSVDASGNGSFYSDTASATTLP